VSLVRHNTGSGHYYVLDGERADGVTTLIGEGLPPRLEKWAAEKTANYALDHWDELTQMPLSERHSALIGARWADKNRAASQGTQVHQLGRELAAGHEVEVPDYLDGYVRSYVSFLDDWEPQPELIEAVVGNRSVGYAGTLDLLAQVGSERWLFDIKTGAGVYGDTALQLAAYGFAEFYLDAEGVECPMTPPDRAAVVHVQPGHYSVYPLPFDAEVFKIFRHVAYVARSRATIRFWVGSEVKREAVKS